MSSHISEELAALALGALLPDEAADVAAQLAVDPVLRTEFAQYQAAAQTLLFAEGLELDASSKRDLKLRILRAAGERRMDVPDPESAAGIVAPERLRRLAPGISWAVLPCKDMTAVYWVFDPPHCSALPLEAHVHEQYGYVLEGECTLQIADAQHKLRTGAHYRIPSGALHGCTFEKRTTLYDVYVPRHLGFERRYAEQLRRPD